MMLKKFALLAAALLIAAAFSGCSKKPSRPNPLDTVMGQGAGGTGGSGRTNNSNGGGFFDPTAIPGDDASLTSRSHGSEDWIENAQRGILEDVYFSFDSASLTPQERQKLDAAAAYLKANMGANLVLEGHCDWRGTGEYNLALGDRRAKSVQTYLEGLGISGNRMQTLSKGDLDATEGASSAQMARERNVALLVVQ